MAIPVPGFSRAGEPCLTNGIHSITDQPDNKFLVVLMGFIQQRSKDFDFMGIYDGIFAIGRTKRDNKLIIVTNSIDYFKDLKDVNTLVRFRREALKRKKLDYIEVNMYDWEKLVAKNYPKKFPVEEFLYFVLGPYITH